ncbi:MAG: N-6 DNA methylase [Gemmatimonadota bacterium]|nr:N-6 DNA methylase [Gemmatimonadota bacterium]
MTTLRRSAELLAHAGSLRGAEAIAAFLGFGSSAPLDGAARAALRLTPGVRIARVADSAGLLRCCIVSASGDLSLRAVAAQTAVRLRDRAPHAQWLVIGMSPASHSVAIVVAPAQGETRIATLVVDTRRVLDSDAETLAAMAAACGASDVLTHQRWRELLGRDALSRRFYRELEQAVDTLATTATGSAPEPARRELGLLTTSRLLFLAFLEAKGWLDGDREFLRRHFDERCSAGGQVHRRLLEPLFFGTLNTPFSKRAAAARQFGRIPFLNGGLFNRTPVERRWRRTTLTDDALGGIMAGLLARYRVTAREDSTNLSEAAIDPEMLGRAFESLMASDDRRKSGAFYTPRPLLERVTAEGIDHWLSTLGISAASRGAIAHSHRLPAAERPAVLAAIRDLRVLDPACGSGAFLVHVLERVADIAAAAGDTRTASERRRDVLTRSIFGVDINPTAVWLCELRLWLSVVIDSDATDPIRVTPLPNLDHNIRIGDALSGRAFDDDRHMAGAAAYAQLRGRYVRATGARKRTLARTLDAAMRAEAVRQAVQATDHNAARRRDLIVALRGRDLFRQRMRADAKQRETLATLRHQARALRREVAALRSGAALPFAFPTHFADIGARGGFDLVLGNPPWVRLHRIAPAARAAFASTYQCWRDANWTDGTPGAQGGSSFSAQVDLAALFLERAIQLTRSGASISLLVPAKLWSSLSSGGIRRVVRANCRIAVLEDWSESPAAFDAVVYPSLIVALRDAKPAGHTIRGAVHKRDSVVTWEQRDDRLALDPSVGAPWLLVPPEVRAAFELLASRGERLIETHLSRPLLGVKTGCNEAFLVTPRPGWRDPAPVDGDGWCVHANGRDDDVERSVLRPVVRGEDVRAWSLSGDQALVWTHGANGIPLERLPPLTSRWLMPWRRRLEARVDATRSRHWWTLFRTEAASMARPRVVWSDISRIPRATVLLPGDPTVPLNTCYVLPTPTIDDALAFAALLNSPPVAAWLCAVAEPARGGYRRFLGWTLSRLPVPRPWNKAVDILAPLGRRAMHGDGPDPFTLSSAVARAYGTRLARLEPLLTWCLR